jgi:hypothetical protein
MNGAESQMTFAYISLTIIASLISGALGAYLTSIHYEKVEQKKIKIDTARRLIGYRYDVLGEGFTIAMNEAFIVFADSSDVIKAMDNLYTVLSTPGKPLADQKLVTFLKSVCQNVGIAHKDLNDSYFLKVFNGKE